MGAAQRRKGKVGERKLAAELREALPDLATRFWRKVRFSAECWNWTGATTRGGYGAAWDGERTVRAHRLAWALTGRRLPSVSLDLCHKCDNPLCVNPWHLFVGDRSANMRDALQKDRGAGKTKLTTEMVRSIKRRLADGESQSAIARAHGVAACTVNDIAKGRSWSSINGQA